MDEAEEGGCRATDMDKTRRPSVGWPGPGPCCGAALCWLGLASDPLHALQRQPESFPSA